MSRLSSWLMARRAWNRAVRQELERNQREGYDSEKLVFDTIARQVLADPSLPGKSLLHMYFRDWRLMKDKLKPPTVVDAQFSMPWQAAMAMIDAVIRLVPGVLGNEESAGRDSFSGTGRLLECAQYTRPREYRGLGVPPVLLSGNHQEIARWREDNSRLRSTRQRKNHEPRVDKPGRKGQHEG